MFYLKLSKYKKKHIRCLLVGELNRFKSSFLVGKVRIEMMQPMDFEKILLGLGKDMWSEEIKRCYLKMDAISIHKQLLELYRTYLCVSGMSQAINEFKNENADILPWDNSVLKNIIILYFADMNKYTLNSM